MLHWLLLLLLPILVNVLPADASQLLLDSSKLTPTVNKQMNVSQMHGTTSIDHVVMVIGSKEVNLVSVNSETMDKVSLMASLSITQMNVRQRLLLAQDLSQAKKKKVNTTIKPGLLLQAQCAQ